MTIPKFRAWNVHEKKMFINDQIIIWNGNVYVNDSPKLNADKLKGWSIDEKYLMQSTGLVDWEGVEIYEGDIVKIPDDYEVFGKNAGETCKVIFDSGCFRLKALHGKGRGFWFEDDSTVTIIGNIYENPKLAEEVK